MNEKKINNKSPLLNGVDDNFDHEKKRNSLNNKPDIKVKFTSKVTQNQLLVKNVNNYPVNEILADKVSSKQFIF